MINKDTVIFGSFSGCAGNYGCELFNNTFLSQNINAIYKSFSVVNIKDAIFSARCLGFGGFAISMPFKVEAIKYVDEISPEVMSIGATNTIVNKNGRLIAYNTDYLAAMDVLSWKNNDTLFVLGNGGYAAAVKYAAKLLNKNVFSIDRKNWESIKDIRDSIIYNCTPTKNEIHNSNEYIDCLIDTNSGKQLARLQAEYQFLLYTGRQMK
jgi:shikimate dehydrogenase